MPSSDTQFKKGQVGNPKGRPKGSLSITDAIRSKLGEVADGEKKTYLELILKRILDKAIKDNDTQTLKLLWNYVDGLPHQSLDVEQKGSLSLKFVIEEMQGRKPEEERDEVVIPKPE